MESKKLLLLSCLTLSMGFGASAQIFNSTQIDLPLWSAPNNTGLAIAPNEDAHALAFDDGGGNYRVYWIQGSTASVFDVESNPGDDPDVAYFGDANDLVVAYEFGGGIWVDDYTLTSPFPFANYSLSGMTNVFGGQYPNIDVNSSGNGILTWELGGDVWACGFSMPGFAAGPPVPIAAGTQPDIVLLDDNSTVALTFVDPNGSLMIYTLDYGTLWGGGVAMLGSHGYDWLGNTAAYPRIAGQRHAGFGPPDDFTVVAQYSNSAVTEVYGIFSTGGTISPSPVLVNSAFSGCVSSDPLPVVAYDRNQVHVAWSQDYNGGCSGLFESNPNNPDDVLLANFDAVGNLLFSTAPGIPAGTFQYEEVNRYQSSFAGFSKTSISTEYDGFFGINNFNYNEGVAFNDPGDLFWKGRNAGNPTYFDESGITEERGNTFSLVTSPVDQTIEVLSESDDFASFQMLDNAGRIVELKTVSNEGNLYNIDISHLSGGMYFLNCSSAAGNEVLRVLQVTK